ncbi:alpha/beta-hydrolase [Aureobasidium pullulans]|uniref:Alpha/beta-hydrolase n=1 Tax=Aureobasidium pullulans TaxID=5580 RepID=A0A4S9BBQ7_AURPU|nr:alpha/beta-hydrolase [Aureobasidium pullulans]
MPPPVQIAFKRIGEPKVGENGYLGFTPGREEVHKAGSRPGNAKALDSDILVQHDVEIIVRDGARLYVDIYRPAGSDEKIPAVLSWSFYGKKYSALDMLPICVWKCCVTDKMLSGLEKFEGLDPAHWCPRGYAIVSVDSRGAGNSDGQIAVMGTQDAEDGFDVVEAIAKMDWCNGNIGMAGNSALAISQWNIAAQQPPSLKAIAPWEGMDDIYREQFCRGGWFSMSNFDLIAKAIVRGQPNAGLEDLEEMYRRKPAGSAFWEDKRIDMKKIKCPVYIRGSEVSALHTMGSIRGWMEIPHDQKWIHWGSTQEWYELYGQPESNDELQKYFDRFLKNKKNDWESTPRLNWSLLQFGDRPAIEHVLIEDFPVPNTDYKEFYLSPNNKLVDQPLSSLQKITYDSEQHLSFAEFTKTFDKPTSLLGLPKAILYVSCADTSRDDFTVFIVLRKLDKNGKTLYHLNFPIEATPVKSIDDIPEKEMASLNLFSGATGILRASHREIDESKSIHPQFPFHPHKRQQKLGPNEIVKLEIGIWAMGVHYDAGESISVRIGGQYPSIAEFTSLSGPRPEHELNRGEHIIHSGPDHPSRIILPFVEVDV